MRAIEMTVVFLMIASVLFLIVEFVEPVSQPVQKTKVEMGVNKKIISGTDSLVQSIRGFNKRTLILIPVMILFYRVAGFAWMTCFSTTKRSFVRRYKG